MSKSSSSRGWVCVFCLVPVLAIISTALLIFAPGKLQSAAANSSASQAPTDPATRSRIEANYAALPLAFEQNQGQTDAQVKYVARGGGYTLFLTAHDAVFSLHSTTASSKHSGIGRWTGVRDSAEQRATKDSTAVVRMQLVGGNRRANVAASDQMSGTSNYFLGNDPGKWRTGVPRFARVSYHNVYPGVNMAFHGAQRQLEFDLLVAPNANPHPIDFQFTGAQALRTDVSGNLIVASAAGDVVLHKPVAYQEHNGTRQPVDARFSLQADNQVRFKLGDYDHSRELVIDPSVSYTYATYLGGALEDDGYAIAFDSSGNAYVTGQTDSTDFHGASGYAGGFDVFVTKISANGASSLYSDYVGGSGDDSGNGIAVDSSNNVVVAGVTNSANFPGTASTGAYQTTLKGGHNAIIFKLNSSGALTYSTYFGGTGSDAASGVALDGSGNIYFAGRTSSTDFPLSSTPLQKTQAGGFLAKLKPAGTGTNDLIFSTYLGGGTQDFAAAVALDSSANAYVTGQTFGSFHTTSGVAQSTFGGLSDAFVTAIKADGSAYIYSTYLGGSNIDIGLGIAVDSSGSAYVTGQTASSNSSTAPFPTTSGAFQTTYGGDPYDAFVTKLNSTGTKLSYSSYLGGSLADYGIAIALDEGGDAYIHGRTLSSSGFPLANATQLSFVGISDTFVSEVNPTGTKLIFSTYLGGTGDQDNTTAGGIAVDSFGATIYVAGNTTAPDFPDTAGFLQPGYAGGATDAFVVKYAQQAFSVTATQPAAVSAGSKATSTVTLTEFNGYNSPVNLSCTVTGTGSPLPTCSATSFAKNPLTPTSSGAQTVLTINTTGPTGALLRPGKIFYAMWLPIAGLCLIGIKFSTSPSQRKKLVGFMMMALALGAIVLMPACGGSSRGGGGGCGTAPGAPTGLAASSTTSTGTSLNWTAAAVGANCTVTGYTVYQNGTSIGTPTGTSFTVTGLTPSTTYNFTVAESDSAGLSAQSTAVPVTTLAGGTPAGTYTITITGTGTDAAATTRSAQVTLTVN